MNISEVELDLLLLDKSEEIDKQASIEKRQNDFIKNLIIENEKILKQLIDPKDEYNEKTLALKYFQFMSESIRGDLGMFYHGTGSIGKNYMKRLDIYKLGWVGTDDDTGFVLCSEKGHEVAKKYFAIEGYKEKTWYTPAKNPELEI